MKYLLIPLTAMLAGVGGMLWAMIRSGSLTDKAMRGVYE
jgi:hypothetical protein